MNKYKQIYSHQQELFKKVIIHFFLLIFVPQIKYDIGQHSFINSQINQVFH